MVPPLTEHTSLIESVACDTGTTARFVRASCSCDSFRRCSPVAVNTDGACAAAVREAPCTAATDIINLPTGVACTTKVPPLTGCFSPIASVARDTGVTVIFGRTYRSSDSSSRCSSATVSADGVCAAAVRDAPCAAATDIINLPIGPMLKFIHAILYLQ